MEKGNVCFLRKHKDIFNKIKGKKDYGYKKGDKYDKRFPLKSHFKF